MKMNTCTMYMQVYGTLRNQPYKIGMTPQYFTPSLHLSCTILQTTHTAKLTRQPISAMSSSNKSLQHNAHSNMPYRSSTAHALRHAQYNTRHAHQHALHTQHYPPSTINPTAFHNPPVHTTNQHKA